MNPPVLIAIAGTLLVAPAVGRPAPVSCDIKDVESVRDLENVLSDRAIEAINRAAGSAPDARLAQLVAPTAPFSLGAGDVGRPLGVGEAGARAFAREMKADSYRVLGWDFIPTPIEDACMARKVMVEFIDTRQHNVYPVTFSFEGGRIVSAEGWTRSYRTGPVMRAPD